MAAIFFLKLNVGLCFLIAQAVKISKIGFVWSFIFY